MNPNKPPINQPNQTTPANPVPPPASPAPLAAPAKGKGAYGKRPMWQWVAIYLVAAIIVYGLIYVLFIHKSGSGGY